MTQRHAMNGNTHNFQGHDGKSHGLLDLTIIKVLKSKEKTIKCFKPNGRTGQKKPTKCFFLFKVGISKTSCHNFLNGDGECWNGMYLVRVNTGGGKFSQLTNFVLDKFCTIKFGRFFPYPVKKYIINKGNCAQGAEDFWQEKITTEKKNWWKLQVTKFVRRSLYRVKIFAPNNQAGKMKHP